LLDHTKMVGLSPISPRQASCPRLPRTNRWKGDLMNVNRLSSPIQVFVFAASASHLPELAPLLVSGADQFYQRIFGNSMHVSSDQSN
jgi:hypothetical protein